MQTGESDQDQEPKPAGVTDAELDDIIERTRAIQRQNRIAIVGAMAVVFFLAAPWVIVCISLHHIQNGAFGAGLAAIGVFGAAVYKKLESKEKAHELT